jgi:hypothetical protein
MLATLLLIIVTVIKGFQIDESVFFVIAECIINVLIITDFMCRIKLVGITKFIKGGFWNIFDFLVVIACVILFLIVLISQTGAIKSLEEVSEEFLLIIWCIF